MIEKQNTQKSLEKTQFFLYSWLNFPVKQTTNILLNLTIKNPNFTYQKKKIVLIFLLTLMVIVDDRISSESINYMWKR